MNQWYINLKCKKCNRFMGTRKMGVGGQEVEVGCKQCKLHTSVPLTAPHAQFSIGYLDISVGHYYDDDC